ncbi:MAG: TadE/TadG family type IV pilus assembly protein [Actinomycetota bacterium]
MLDERGASIVEFALIVPIFLMILMGLVQFGRAYNVQISLTGAAREGARDLALGKTDAVVQTSTLNAAPGVCGSGCTVTFDRRCPNTAGAKLTVSKSVNFSFGTFLPFNRTLSGSATMRCSL